MQIIPDGFDPSEHQQPHSLLPGWLNGIQMCPTLCYIHIDCPATMVQSSLSVSEHHAIQTWLNSWSYLVPALDSVYIKHGYDEDLVNEDDMRRTDTYYGSSSCWDRRATGAWVVVELDEHAAERANRSDPFGF